MFSDSLLENSIRPRRRWTTIASFAIETVAVALLVLLPLLGSVALPTTKLSVTTLPFGRPDAPPSAKPQRQPAHAMAVLADNPLRLHAPSRIDQRITPERPNDVSQQVNVS